MQASKRNPKDKYVLFSFLAFFGVVFLVNGIFIYTAIKTQTGVVTEQAYEKGLAYNKTLEDAQNQPALKDKITYSQPVLRWVLRDETDAPLLNGVAKGHMIRPVQDGHDFDISFISRGDGVYEAMVMPPLKGQWVVKLESVWTQNNQEKSYKTTYQLMAK